MVETKNKSVIAHSQEAVLLQWITDPEPEAPGAAAGGIKGGRTDGRLGLLPTPQVLRTPGTTGETGAEVEQLCDVTRSGPWDDRAMREWMKQNQKNIIRKERHTYIYRVIHPSHPDNPFPRHSASP